MIKKTKKLFYLLLFICVLFSNKLYKVSASNHTKSMQNNQKNEPMYYNNNLSLTEEEITAIMQNVYEEYQKLPEEEKATIAKEFGIPVAELEKNMNEVGDFLKQNNQSKNTKGTFENSKTISSHESSFDTSTNIIPQDQIQKNKLEEQKNTIKNIEKCTFLLDIFLTKIEDPFAKDTIKIDRYIEIKINIKMIIYYIKILLEKSTQKAFPEIYQIEKFAEIINTLEENIKSIIPLEEYINNKMEDSLYTKYQIKKQTQENLIEKIQYILQNETDSLEDLKKSLKKNKNQTTKAKIAYIENKINILEQDLIKAQTNNNENIIKNIEDTILITHNAIEFALKTIENTIQKYNFITFLEEIIKKQAPEEIENGKKITKQIQEKLKTEKKLYEQIGSQGNIISPKDIINKIENTNNKDSNTFKYQQLNTNSKDKEYNNNNNNEEKSKLLDKDKNHEKNTNQNKESKKVNKINKEKSDIEKQNNVYKNTDGQKNVEKETPSKKKNKSLHKLNKNEKNIYSKTISTINSCNHLLDNLYLENKQDSDIKQNKNIIIEKLNDLLKELEKIIIEIPFDKIIFLKLPLKEQLYKNFSFNEESKFIQYLDSLKKNDTDTSCTIDQKIYNELFLLRENIINIYIKIKNLDELLSVLSDLNKIIDFTLTQTTQSYKKAMKKIPFWLSDWQNIEKKEDLLNKNLLKLEYPIKEEVSEEIPMKHK